MSDIDPNALATHGGTGGVGFLLAVLWQKVFGKKESDGLSKRVSQLATDVEVLKSLHKERNNGDEFKRNELEQLKKDRTELQTQMKEMERRVGRLEDK